MQSTSALESTWSAALAALSGLVDLDQSSRDFKALRRLRQVRSAAGLLRLALGCSIGGLSLRRAAVWAEASDLGRLSHVALYKRLARAAGWLGHLAGALLGRKVSAAARSDGRKLRLVDGSVISAPGSAGGDWRLHAVYEPAAARLSAFELTDIHGAEGFERFVWEQDDVAIGDRGNARLKGLRHVRAASADFLVRLGWNSLRLALANGRRLEWEPIFAALDHGAASEHAVQLLDPAAPKRRTKRKAKTPSGDADPTAPLTARLVVLRLPPEAAAKAVLRARRGHARRRAGSRLNPMTVRAAEFVILLTSLPLDVAAAEILAMYRLRWQVELVFKRLKSLQGFGDLRFKTPDLARCCLYAQLIAALVSEDRCQACLDSLPFSPGFDRQAGFALAAA